MDDTDFAETIERVYADRNYDTDPTYSDVDPVYLQRVQSMERAYLDAMRRLGLAQHLSELKVLDYGCGNGRWAGRWIAWGAKAKNVYGVDVRQSAVDVAQQALPCCEFRICQSGAIPHANASFDVCVANLAFSSMLSDGVRAEAAKELIRVLRPGGIAFIFDFAYRNKSNPNVRPVLRSEIVDLFSGLREALSLRLVLAPPIARRLVPISRLVADAVETSVPFLRTHRLWALRRRAG